MPQLSSWPTGTAPASGWGVKVQLFLVGGVPRIRVGLDIDEPAKYETFAGTHSGIEFDLSRSHRHVLSIRNSSAPVVASWRAVN